MHCFILVGGAAIFAVAVAVGEGEERDEEEGEEELAEKHCDCLGGIRIEGFAERVLKNECGVAKEGLIVRKGKCGWRGVGLLCTRSVSSG